MRLSSKAYHLYQPSIRQVSIAGCRGLLHCLGQPGPWCSFLVLIIFVRPCGGQAAGVGLRANSTTWWHLHPACGATAWSGAGNPGFTENIQLAASS